jgi:hypothetical protein
VARAGRSVGEPAELGAQELVRLQHAHPDVNDLVLSAGDRHQAHPVLGRDGAHGLGERLALVLPVVDGQEGPDVGDVCPAPRWPKRGRHNA